MARPSLEEIEAASMAQQPQQRPSLEEIEASSMAQPQQQQQYAAPESGDTTSVSSGFLNQMGALTSGAVRGAMTFGATLGSLAERALRLGGEPKIVPTVYHSINQNFEEYAKDPATSFMAGVGNLAGELGATSPAGKLFNMTYTGAKALAEKVPTGLKTLTKYGSKALADTGILAGIESQRFDPENPGQLINTEAASKVLENPLSAAIPSAVGTKLQTWSEAARNLANAQKEIPGIMARQVQPESAARTFKMEVFGIPSSLTRLGGETAQMKTIGKDVENYISKLSGSADAILAKDAREYAGKVLFNDLKRLEKVDNELWNKPFKTAPVTDVQGVKDEVINALDLMAGSKIGGESLITNNLLKGMRKPNLTVEDVKQLRTQLSIAIKNAYNIEGGAGRPLGEALTGVKANLMDKIKSSIKPEDMADFTEATQYHAFLSDLKNTAPAVRKAFAEEVDARKLVTNLMGNTERVDKKVLDALQPDTVNQMAAAKLADAVKQADSAKGFNLGTFLDNTSRQSFLPELMGGANAEKWKAFEGFRKYLEGINESANLGWWRQAAVAGMVGATGALSGGLAASSPGAVAALTSLGAMNFVANTSPLKKIFNAMTKDLPEGTYKALMDAATRHLTRGGYLMQDGKLDKPEKESK